LFSEKITSRDFKKAFIEDNQLHVEVTDGLYNIQFYNSEIVETSFIPKGEAFNTKSHAVVLVPEKKLAKLTETDSTLVYSLKDFTVKTGKEPCKTDVRFEEEQVISARNGYQRNSTYETVQFSINTDEVVYGSGARALAMNRRGHRLQLYHTAHYGYEPRS